MNPHRILLVSRQNDIGTFDRFLDLLKVDVPLPTSLENMVSIIEILHGSHIREILVAVTLFHIGIR